MAREPLIGFVFVVFPKKEKKVRRRVVQITLKNTLHNCLICIGLKGKRNYIGTVKHIQRKWDVKRKCYYNHMPKINILVGQSQKPAAVNLKQNT